MAKLDTCATCGGFVPAALTACPHCRATVLKAAKLVGGVIGGSVIAFTLMACYGRPPCKDGTQDCHYPPTDEASTPSTVAPKTSAPPTTSSPTTSTSAK